MKEINLLQKGYLFGADEILQSIYHKTTDSGKSVRFVCSSDSITLGITLRRIANVSQMVGISLMNGCYYRIFDAETDRLLIQSICVNKALYQEHKLPGYFRGSYEIFLPFFNNIESLVLALPDNTASVQMLPCNNNRIIMYGGPKFLGVGCTSANFICSNIMQRRLKAEVLNLSVWNRSFLDNRMGEYFAAYKPEIIIIECSCKGMTLKYLKENLSAYLADIIKSNKDCTIVILGEDNWYMTTEKGERKELVKETVNQFRKKEKASILYVDGKDIFGDSSEDMFTYSSNFYNDYANYKMAEYLIPLLKACI